MTSDLVRTKLEKTLQVKSLTDLVRVRTSEEIYLLLDVSGSMKSTMRNGKQCIDGLREVVREISQGRSVQMIAFGGIDGGAYAVSSVPNAGGGTPLHSAIELARNKNAGRAVVISDGQPDDQRAAMDAAKKFNGKIDVVYVGDPGDAGEHFLRNLANSTGGTEFHGDLSEPKALSSQITALLTTGSVIEDGEGE